MYKVLIVEDEHYLRSELTHTVEWERYGCSIIGSVTDAESAKELSEKTKPDLVITDIRLPGISGLELLRDISPAAAIIITGYDQFEYAREALRIGVVDFLLKPIDDDELQTAIRKATLFLSGRRSENNRPTVPEPNSASAPQIDNKNRHVNSARRFIQRHYKEDISLFQAAENLELSESYLSRIFKECTGNTFVEELTQYRISIASNLLLDHRLRIEEIAAMSGFRSAGYFTRIFRRYTGMSPSNFRCVH